MINPDDVSKVASLAVSLVPGAAAIPEVPAVVGALAGLITRLIEGESFSQIEAEPTKRATGIDVDALKADLEAAAK